MHFKLLFDMDYTILFGLQMFSAQKRRQLKMLSLRKCCPLEAGMHSVI